MDQPVVKTLDEVSEFNEVSQYMQDPDLDWVMESVLTLMTKQDIPFEKVNANIVRLQAASTKFKIQAKYHMLFNKSDEGNKRKNIYLTAADSIDRLVDSLKYLSRRT